MEVVSSPIIFRWVHSSPNLPTGIILKGYLDLTEYSVGGASGFYVFPAISSNNGLDFSAHTALYTSIISLFFTMVYVSWCSFSPHWHWGSILLFATGIPIAENAQGKMFFILGTGEARNMSIPGLVNDTSAKVGPVVNITPMTTAWERYQTYLALTSILFPIPPVIYRPLSKVLKLTVLLDFPMYWRFEIEEGGQEARLLWRNCTPSCVWLLQGQRTKDLQTCSLIMHYMSLLNSCHATWSLSIFFWISWWADAMLLASSTKLLQ